MRRKNTDNNSNKLLYDPDERLNQRLSQRLGVFSMSEENDSDDFEDEENSTANDNDSYGEKLDTDNSISQNQEQLDSSDEKDDVNKNKNAVNNPKKMVDNAKKIATNLPKAMTLLSNPHFWLIFGGIVLFIIILSVIFQATATDTGDTEYSIVCNYNLTNVSVKTCNSDETDTLPIGDYVKQTAYKISLGKDYSNDMLKALMIILKHMIIKK